MKIVNLQITEVFKENVLYFLLNVFCISINGSKWYINVGTIDLNYLYFLQHQYLE